MAGLDGRPTEAPPVALDEETQFTVYIRLPFPRGDFVDPSPVNWDSTKDQGLWDILTRASKGREIDCELSSSSSLPVTRHSLED